VALGTAGGPKWWGREDIDAGISTAIVVDGAIYMVDYGYGASRQLVRSSHSFDNVKAVFITHMHSDHTVDLPSLLLFGSMDVTGDPIKIIGPGPRGKLPPLTSRTTKAPDPVNPQDPVPGIEETFRRLVQTYSSDINDRMFDYGSPSPASKFAPRDIIIPEGVPFDPNNNVAPEMVPFTIYSDERVTVTAILVDHHPTAPAYAFRFESQYGSIVISGDTGYSENTIRIAQDCDMLFHEVIDLEKIELDAQTEYTEHAHREAVMDHHKRSHTSPENAGKVAQAANAKALALHHYVPAGSPRSVWEKAGLTFGGRLVIPEDLDIIEVASDNAETKHLTKL